MLRMNHLIFPCTKGLYVFPASHVNFRFLTVCVPESSCWRRQNTEQKAIFLLVLSAPTFLNQLGEADSLTVFNNGEKNEKILKVALPPEWLSGERNSTAMQFIVTKLAAPGCYFKGKKKPSKTNK